MNNISTTNTKVFLDAVATDKSQVKTISPVVFFRRILGIGERVDLSEVMRALQRYAINVGKSTEFQKRFISNGYAGDVITFDVGNNPAWMQFKVVREPLPDDAASTAINFIITVVDEENHKRWNRLIGAIAKEQKPDKSGTVSVLRTISDMCDEEDLPFEKKNEDINPGDEEPVVEATQHEDTPATQAEVKEEAKPVEEPKKEEATHHDPDPRPDTNEEQTPAEEQKPDEPVAPAEESVHPEEVQQPDEDHEGDENAETISGVDSQEIENNNDDSEEHESIPDIDNKETEQDNGDSSESEEEPGVENNEPKILLASGSEVEFVVDNESHTLSIVTSDNVKLVEMQDVNGVIAGKYKTITDFTKEVLNTKDINKVMECFEMEQKKEEVKTVGEIPITTLCKDEHKDYEYLEMLFGTPNPSILHVINRIKSAQEKSPSMEYELTGSFPIEQMICFSDYSFSIVRMKSGSYYRIFVAHTDLDRGADGCWLKTNSEKDRWFMIGNVNDRDVDMINKRRR